MQDAQRKTKKDQKKTKATSKDFAVEEVEIPQFSYASDNIKEMPNVHMLPHCHPKKSKT
jgi:hypothetical protein